jgi:uncharacterized integral membrane protein
MTDLWLKIRVWTKTVLFGLIALYALFFLYNNSGSPVRIWLFFGNEAEMPVLVLVFLVFAAGIVGTLLVRTTITTIRQIRQISQRSTQSRQEREAADMKAKAAMLQTRPEGKPQGPSEG